jgi:hypothetical protein
VAATRRRDDLVVLSGESREGLGLELGGSLIVLVDSTTRFFSPVISVLRRVICASRGSG